MTDSSSPLPAPIIQALPMLKLAVGGVELVSQGYNLAEAQDGLDYLLDLLRKEHSLFSAEQAKQNYHG